MIDLRIKAMFFDRAKVVRAADKAKRAVLARAGAFVRQTARTSLRTRKGTSAPGSPPHSHVGLLRRFILFGYDAPRESVVVGPARLASKPDAPHALEFGGRSTQRSRRGRRTVRIRARPFMAPALAKEAPKLPKLWANSVRSS